jgi:hypothetical protein
MPLKAARGNDRTGAVTAAFADIGRAGDTLLPRSRTTLDRLAEEFWRSQVLNRLAEKRKDESKAAAVAGGVLPDYKAEPSPVGTAETVYSGATVAITLRVNAQADHVDVPGLVADLEKAGVKPAVLRRLVRKHTTSFGGAHVFTASLVTG